MERTAVEQMAMEIAPELDRLINDILARPGGDAESERRRAALKTFLWDNKVGLLRIAEAHQVLVDDCRETLAAVYDNFGLEGLNKVTSACSRRR